MMETVDRDGVVRDASGVPIDRIEGGSLTPSAGEFRGIAPTTVLIGAVVVILLGLFLGWYLFHARSSGDRPASQSAAGTATSVPQRDAITEAQAREALLGQPDAGPLGPAGQPQPPGAVAGQIGPAAAGQGPGGTASAAQKSVDPKVALDQATRRSPIMGFSGASQFAQATRLSGPVPEPSAADGEPASDPNQRHDDPASGGATLTHGPTATTSQDGLSSQLTHHVVETARASVVPDRAFLLSAGTLVPCTLQTAINSTQAGYVSCAIGQDVFSEDGRVVLLDKGTKVLGQYSGGISQGQARLFVLWTRALTPRGVAIDLGSPATDDLGRAGMAGGVDTMFWQRFGAALMLSVIEDLGNVASSHFAGRGTQTTQVPADTAGVALQNSVNIRPVLKKNQGDQVAIFIAKDFDFSTVYDVHVRR